MDTLRPQDISLLAAERLFQLVHSLKPEHKPGMVWMYIDMLIHRYRQKTGLTKAQLAQELESYAQLMRAQSETQLDTAFAEYNTQVDSLDALISELTDDDATLALFLTLNRVAPIHCSLLGIDFAQMMRHLEKFAAEPAQGAQHVGPAGVC